MICLNISNDASGWNAGCTADNLPVSIKVTENTTGETHNFVTGLEDAPAVEVTLSYGFLANEEEKELTRRRSCPRSGSPRRACRGSSCSRTACCAASRSRTSPSRARTRAPRASCSCARKSAPVSQNQVRVADGDNPLDVRVSSLHMHMCTEPRPAAAAV